MGAPVVWDMMVVRNRSYYYLVLLNFQPIPPNHSPTFQSPLRSRWDVTPPSCPDYAWNWPQLQFWSYTWSLHSRDWYMWFWPVCWFTSTEVFYHHVVLPLMFVSRFFFCMDFLFKMILLTLLSPHSSLVLFYNSGSYSNMDYTFGGTYNGGNRADVSGYDRTATLQGSISFEPERVNARMYQHVSTRGTCLSVPVPPPGVSFVLLIFKPLIFHVQIISPCHV